MGTETSTYRWNTSAAAEAYDAAAPVIHPYYEKVQDEILNLLAFKGTTEFELVDLGGGSGRLAERVLATFPNTRATVVDQSEPFLALAERRLAPFVPRGNVIQGRLQDDWAAELTAAPDVIVSTSAIHHMEPPEKQALFARCYAALKPGGLFINGDEYRPAGDGAYRALLEDWSAHMRGAIDQGRIPESFRATYEQWYDRNLRRFGDTRKSGDDCLETANTQVGYLREVGFEKVRLTWSEQLWGVMLAAK